MWSHWNDVTRKLKDIAVEIATPQYVETGECDEKGKGEGHYSLDREGASRWLEHELHEEHHEGMSSGRVSQAADSPSTYRSHGVAPPRVTHAGAEAVKSDGRAGPPVRLATPSVSAVGPPSSSRPTASSTDQRIPHCDDRQHRERGFSLGEMQTVEEASVRANSNDVAHSHQAQVDALQKQLHLLSEQKRQLESRVLAYQEEVAESHRKTVAYYEQQAEDLRRGIASERAQKEHFEKELTRRTSECEDLKDEVKRLQQQMEDLVREADNTRKVSDELKALLAAREQEHLEDMRQLEILQQTHNALVEEIKCERERETKEPAKAAVPIAQSDAGVGNEIDFHAIKQLHQHTEALEQERLALLVERDRLTLLLEQEQEVHRAASEAKDDMLHHTRAQAEELSRLIERLEAEQQQQQQQQSPKGEDDEQMEVIDGGEQNARRLKEGTSTSALQVEIATLMSKLEEARQESEEAVQRVSEALKVKHAEELALSLERQAQQTQVTIEALQCELRDAQRHATESEGRQMHLQEEILQLRNRLTDSESNIAALSSKLASAEALVVELQPASSAPRHVNGDQETLLISALTARKRELEAESAKLQELMQQLEHTITDCLVRMDTELPPFHDGAGASFTDKIALLVSEFHRMSVELRQAARQRREWELTYEQARDVNTTLKQQVTEAWKTIGSLREDLSMRDQSLAKLRQQVRADAQQLRDTQHLLANVTNELQVLKEEKRTWRTHVEEPHVGESDHQAQMAALTANVDVLKRALQERDEELAQAQQSMENMQDVLDTFTLNKGREIEERTADMQIEMDHLRAELLVAEQQRQVQQSEMDALAASSRRSLAAKNLEITSLHRKHAELRRALDETARQLSNGTMIDKRVISHLTVNYIHAFVAQRQEADEMLKVLSGLLNWDEKMQEKAGLLPGPTNPKPGQQQRRTNIIGGIMNTVWGNPSRAAAAAAAAGGGGGGGGVDGGGSAGREARSIAELWVEFLIRESEAVVHDAEVAAVPAVDASASFTVPPVEGAALIEDAVASEGSGDKNPTP